MVDLGGAQNEKAVPKLSPINWQNKLRGSFDTPTYTVTWKYVIMTSNNVTL
jgi:hypothetical protein